MKESKITRPESTLQIDEAEAKSLADLLLQSDLLAGMARADGKVLDVENTVAATYFE